MKPDTKPWEQMTLSERMRRVEEQLKSGHVEPVPTPVSRRERSPKEQAETQKVLDQVWGSITPQRAEEWNAEIRKMRDEEWD